MQGQVPTCHLVTSRLVTFSNAARFSFDGSAHAFFTGAQKSLPKPSSYALPFCETIAFTAFGRWTAYLRLPYSVDRWVAPLYTTGSLAQTTLLAFAFIFCTGWCFGITYWYRPAFCVSLLYFA